MSAEANKALIREYAEALRHDKSPATLERYISDESLKQHIVVAEAAFPGYTMDVDDLIADGDRVCLRTTLRAVHTGAFMGVPPSGNTIAVPGVVIYRIEGGKIAEHWLFLDNMALMQQISAPQSVSV